MLGDFSAIVLAGGRSRRLGGVPKAGLSLEGTSLLRRAVDTVGLARSVVVVGPRPQVDPLDGTGAIWTRESPHFGGPSAALAAGLRALPTAADAPPWAFVAACDMPWMRPVLHELAETDDELADAGVDAYIAVDAGRLQPLAGFYRIEALHGAIRDAESGPGVTGLPVRRLIANLRIRHIHVTAGTTADIDTWSDARSAGITGPSDAASGRCYQEGRTS